MLSVLLHCPFTVMEPNRRLTLLPYYILGVYGIQRGPPAFLIICILISVLALAASYPELCFETSSNVRYLLDTFQGYGPIATYLVIILEAFLSRNKIEDIWRLVKETLDIFSVHLRSPLEEEYHKCLQSCRIFFFLLHGITSFFDIFILATITQNFNWFHNRLIGYSGYIGCRTMILFHILHVSVFKFLMKAILEHQKRINFKFQFGGHGKYEGMIRRQLEVQMHLKRAYNKLVRINWLINDAFKFSLTCVFSMNVICSIINWIWTYLTFRFGNQLLFREYFLY